MRIGVDCRIYGLKHAGIGRYVKNLVENLLAIDKKNEYFLFVRRESRQEIIEQIKASNYKLVLADFPHYSFKEQLFFPTLIAKNKIDLMHFTHFNIPVFYQGKFIVTIHDLIKHLSRGRQTTTRSAITYWPKYLAYKFVFGQAVKRSSKIIVPSKAVKNELISEYKMCSDKIAVTYEGVDNKVINASLLNQEEILNKYLIKRPFLLYVGSVYPHKNIERLIKAIKNLNQKSQGLQLVVVCGRNIFLQRLEKVVRKIGILNMVNLVGFVPDNDLAVLYAQAEAFVFPTLSEGFGLPGLEAMGNNCLVICSDILVLKEIYQEAAIYFDPKNINDMTEKIQKVLKDEGLKKEMREKGRKQAGKYSWAKTASETLKVYNSA